MFLQEESNFVSSTRFFFHKYSFWSKRGIKGPLPFPLLGTLWVYMKSPSTKDAEAELLKEYGKVVGIYEGVTPVLLLAEPDLIKEVLVKNFASFTDNYQFHGHHILKKMMVQYSGDEWRKARSIMSPAFTSGKLKLMLPVISNSIDLLEKAIKKHIESGNKTMDSKHFLTCLTLDIIAKVAFAADIDAHENQDDQFVRTAKSIFHISKKRLILGYIFPEYLKRKTDFSLFEPEYIEYLLAACQAMLQQRKKEGNTQAFTDFGQLLLEARNEKGEGFTDEEIVANAFLVLAAGFETTATLMTMVSWVLSTEPKIQEKVYQEVLQCYQSKGNKFDYDSIGSLPYLEAFLHEVLRMYPPLVRFNRIASEDVTLSNGVHIKKGTIIRVPVFSIQRSQEYYKDPDTFDPDRFLPENKDQLIPYTFMPFVLGPRNCIGARFALLEAKHATANIILKFKFSQSNPNASVDFTGGSFMLAPKEVSVQVEQRQIPV